MATRKRKTRRLRASRTHGWGRSGQHRDSGMQGGHGNAGWKRHRWSSVIRYGWQIGKTGFTPVNKHPEKAVNVGDLDIERLIEQGAARQTAGRLEVDLGQIGYEKLLGGGRISQPVRIIVDRCTVRAASKVSEAGGEVILPETQHAKQG